MLTEKTLTNRKESEMIIDWNGNGKIDPGDIAISLATEETGAFDEEYKDEEV